MMRQKSSKLCWSTVLSLLHPSAADGEWHTGQIAPVWHSWICCLLPGSPWHSQCWQISLCRCLCQSVLEVRGGMWEGAPGLMCTSRTRWHRVFASSAAWAAHETFKIITTTVCVRAASMRLSSYIWEEKSKRRRMQTVNFPLVQTLSSVKSPSYWRLDLDCLVNKNLRLFIFQVFV